MGVDTTASGAAQLLTQYDEHPDGKMDIGEFRKLVKDLEVKFAAEPSGGMTATASRTLGGGIREVSGGADTVASAFAHYDTNGSGFLDYKELRSALRHMGVDTNVQGAAQLMVAYDDRPDGKMDIGEFRKLVDDLGVKFGGTTTTTTYLSSGTTTVRNSSRSLNTDTVGASFAHYDTNNSGFLDYQELRNALSHMGIDTSASGAAQILAAYDERPDGKMDIGEFRKLAHDMEEHDVGDDDVGVGPGDVQRRRHRRLPPLRQKRQRVSRLQRAPRRAEPHGRRHDGQRRRTAPRGVRRAPGRQARRLRVPQARERPRRQVRVSGR